MPGQRNRATDRGPRRYAIVIHIVSGLMTGWMAKTYFPEHTALEVLGKAWNFIFTTIAGLGGVAVITSLGLAIFNVYKWFSDKRSKAK